MKGQRELFFEEHGGQENCVKIDDTWMLFADGAWMEVFSYGAMVEPPADNYERLKLQKQYREVKLRLATNSFNDLKNRLMHQAQEAIKWAAANAPPVPPNAADIEELQRLQAEVHQRQRDLQQVSDELEDAKPKFVKDRDARAIENEARNTAALSAIAGIKI